MCVKILERMLFPRTWNAVFFPFALRIGRYMQQTEASITDIQHILSLNALCISLVQRWIPENALSSHWNDFVSANIKSKKIMWIQVLCNKLLHWFFDLSNFKHLFLHSGWTKWVFLLSLAYWKITLHESGCLNPSFTVCDLIRSTSN